LIISLPLTLFLYFSYLPSPSVNGKKRPRPVEEAAPTPDVIAAALGAIKAGKMSLRKASRHYGVDKSKLHRIVNKVQTASAKWGGTTAMPKEVEDILAQKLMLLVKNHFYLEMVNLPFVALEICEKLGIRKTKWVAGRKWVANFFKRHPELSPRKSGKISRARSLHFNLITHAEWYAALKEFIHLYKPEEIFNTDDTGCVFYNCLFHSHPPPPPSFPQARH
jgi:hypothetical protein